MSLFSHTHDIPLTLVYRELCLPMIFGIRIRGTHDPCWRIADAQVEDLPLLNKNMQTVNDLFDRRGVVPPVEIEYVYPVAVELLKAVAHRKMQRPSAIAELSNPSARLISVLGVWSGILGRNDHTISIATKLKPFSNPLLRLFVLVYVCSGRKVSLFRWRRSVPLARQESNSRVNKVPASLHKRVEQLENIVFRCFASDMRPRIAKSHTSQLQRTDPYCCFRRKQSILSESCRRFWRRL